MRTLKLFKLFSLIEGYIIIFYIKLQLLFLRLYVKFLKYKIRKKIRKDFKAFLCSQLVSTCCKSPVKCNFLPDFFGDSANIMSIGTIYYICTKCKNPCDIKLRKKKSRRK